MTIWQSLQKDLRRRAGAPIITWRNRVEGRVELSGTTFGNAVSKAANFFRDEIEADPGLTVRVELKNHWQSAVWNCAVLCAGHSLSDSPHSEYLITNNEQSENQDSASSVVRISSHPLGIPDMNVEFPEINGSLLVRSQPDVFHPTDFADLAFKSAKHNYSYDDLVILASAHAFESGSRVAITGSGTSLERLLWHCVIPIETGISVVLCDEVNDEVFVAEHITQVIELKSVG